MPESQSAKDPQPPIQPPAPGYVYNPVYLEHDTRQDPENPETARRLEAIISGLDMKFIRPRLKLIPARPATTEELTLVHNAEYVQRVDDFCKKGGGSWDVDTYLSPGSFKAALYAAGGAIEAVKYVVKEEVPFAYALVRPPGHHAVIDNAMGFCVFNNIAVAACYATSKLSVKRVLILDFDIHHGNGSQQAFTTSPDVQYISIHQASLFPGTGHIEDPGSAINIPLPDYCGDNEYRQVFNEVIVPAARRFQPELLLVSAGYDGHWADRYDTQMTLDGYFKITEIIKQLGEELCQGRTVFVLEGGYNLQVLTCAVSATFSLWLDEKFLDDPLGQPQQRIPPPDITDLLAAVKKRHDLI
jgi:acetoin utilization deacetylase AcuC-like enzyme